jgi:hypothetical protein
MPVKKGRATKPSALVVYEASEAIWKQAHRMTKRFVRKRFRL